MRHHTSALEKAKTVYQRGVSLVNASDIHRHIGNNHAAEGKQKAAQAEYEQAVKKAVEALSLEPTIDVWWCYLLLAFYKTGRKDKVGEILRRRALGDKFRIDSAFAAYARTFDEFKEMEGDIPEYGMLMDRIWQESPADKNQ